MNAPSIPLSWQATMAYHALMKQIATDNPSALLEAIAPAMREMSKGAGSNYVSTAFANALEHVIPELVAAGGVPGPAGTVVSITTGKPIPPARGER